MQGTYGWHINLKRKGNKGLSPSDFYVYHMKKRNTPSDYLLNAERLFQEWILFGLSMAENQRLYYIGNNKEALRADSYSNLRAELHRRQDDQLYIDDNLQTIGMVVLPSSHTGSPRYYAKKFANSQSIVK